MQSVPIITKFVSLNPAHGEVYSVCQWFATDSGFLQVLRFPPPIKLIAQIYNWNIVESCTKHHNPNPIFYGLFLLLFKLSSLYGGKKTWPQNDNQNNQTFSVIFSEGHVFQTCTISASLSMYKMYHNYQLSVANNLQKNIYTTNENNVYIFHLSFFLLLFFLFYPGKLYFHNIIKEK